MMAHHYDINIGLLKVCASGIAYTCNLFADKWQELATVNVVPLVIFCGYGTSARSPR
jgi:hypothetical protein